MGLIKEIISLNHILFKKVLGVAFSLQYDDTDGLVVAH